MNTYDLRPARESDRHRIFESYRITVGPYVAKAWGWDESFQRAGFWRHHPLDEFKVIQVEGSLGGGLHLEEDTSMSFVQSPAAGATWGAGYRASQHTAVVAA